MSTPVGRHRAPRQAALRRPAVAATATLSALAVSAAGYASATDLDSASASGNLSGLDALAPAGKAHTYQSFDRSSVMSMQQSVSRARSTASVRDRAAMAKRMADSHRLQASASQASMTTLRQMVASRTSQAQDMVAAKVAPKPAPAPVQKASRSTTEDAPRVQSHGDPRDIARSMLASYGWSSSQFSCLDKLWTKESGWSTSANNPSSSAYGIPQALPGSKMATAGSDWRTNAATQIEWGLGYIKERYGSPCSAWSHSVDLNWY
ncbi:lytic transglycosylase domain-containing protein [Luteipulveratus sp. YIM 133132]|uniref:Lytic transglycosylase domain-containing protein n=1 Tax=Luteipulveratus flavus TaxID=3031728 RepID=A0ABT6C3B8_9MICO|nr:MULTISPECIES: lytic transglycosylase domain-containing protein [unclassified Luteipulveratus]MDE9367198.1 lytic transglycosylase domain-containing protein [Luteipulveratus sp. YIM 133132]MDF8263185.1 lytic transglycosylase domain-containing protein [Luteipulveratus sp. YIM 133296]